MAEHTDPGSHSELSQSHSSTIDEIFKELTYTARTVDLRRQDIEGDFNWRWMALAGGAALAALAGVLIFFLTRSG